MKEEELGLKLSPISLSLSPASFAAFTYFNFRGLYTTDTLILQSQGEDRRKTNKKKPKEEVKKRERDARQGVPEIRNAAKTELYLFTNVKHEDASFPPYHYSFFFLLLHISLFTRPILFILLVER